MIDKEILKQFILEKFASYGLSKDEIKDILKNKVTKEAHKRVIDECVFQKKAVIDNLSNVLFGSIPAAILTAGALAGPTIWLLTHPDEKLFKAMSERRKVLRRELRETDLQNPNFFKTPFPTTTLDDTGVLA